MRLQLSCQQLLHVLQRIYNIVERKPTKPILSHVLLEAADGMLCITGRDQKSAMGMQARIASDVQTSGRTTVSARTLLDALKEMDAELLTLDQDGAFLHLRGGASRFRLAHLDADDYPILQTQPNTQECNNINMPAATLARMLTVTNFAISNDLTRPHLTGALFHVCAEELRIATTDTHRLCMATINLENIDIDGEIRSIVPRKMVIELKRMSDEHDNNVSLNFTKGMLHAQAGIFFLSCKLIDKRFPAYEKVMQVSYPNNAIISCAAFEQVLRRMMVVANDITHDVRLHFGKNELRISAHNEEQEEAEETIAVICESPEQIATIGFNARYLRDVLAVMQTEKLRMVFHDDKSRVLVMAESDKEADNAANERFIIMPMSV
ncbi:MAG: DNA polymerase III subunit beta [Mariprofundales bacterium]